jgi:tetratricopeptide (TPR) repeat protein
MNRLFFRISVFFALPMAAAWSAQQPVAPPQADVPHSKIFQSGWLPQAKTPAEYQAYARAAEVTGAAEAEKSAEQFAMDYPDSEMRYLLFSRVMRLYQEANNGDEVLKNGRKVLAFHPNDPVALVMISTVLAEHTRDDDPDKDARFTEALKHARRAINSIDTGLIIPPHTSEIQIQQAKNSLLCAAHASIGLVELIRGQNIEAARELRASLDAGKADPNPLTWLRLSLAQEREKDYAAALASVNQALLVAEPNSEIEKLARQEQNRLLNLTSPDGSSQTSGQK